MLVESTRIAKKKTKQQQKKPTIYDMAKAKLISTLPRPPGQNVYFKG